MKYIQIKSRVRKLEGELKIKEKEIALKTEVLNMYTGDIAIRTYMKVKLKVLSLYARVKVFFLTLP